MEPSQLLDACPFTTFQGPVFRAIFTSFPTRNLYSDIGFREGDSDYEIAMYLADVDASIDFAQPQQLRPFQYSNLDNFLKTYVSEVIPRKDLVYPLLNAQKGRFSDGTFGVFYAALEEATSLAEVAYHFVEECQYDLKMSPAYFTSREVDKRIVQLDLEVEMIQDLRPFHQDVPMLTSDKLDYCQQLGILLRNRGVPMILTPSARVDRGNCSPIFSEKALPSEPARTIRYYHFKFDKSKGLDIKKSDLRQTSFTIPSDWKLP